MIEIKKIIPIHPFAARMATEIAFNALDGLSKDCTILDPMAGSGTVLRTISALGYNGIGIDIDPLAVLMSTAWTTQINEKGFLGKVNQILNRAKQLKSKEAHLPWIDKNKNTKDFISFWFAPKQSLELRKLSYVINSDNGKYAALLKIALSRLIITKSRGASLAADVSHSRPHKVRQVNDFRVFEEYEKACKRLSTLMLEYPPTGNIFVKLGDARKMKIKSESVDAIITSPPYLNAIDYMRGHKLALVWLGYKIDELCQIRSISVGAEKAPDRNANLKMAKNITSRIRGMEKLPIRKINMIHRYALDMHQVIKESSRVLKKNARATFVIGNTIQNGIYIENTTITEESAKQFGLKLVNTVEREIPENRRYLPPPTSNEKSSLKNRMKTEVIMTFCKI